MMTTQSKASGWRTAPLPRGWSRTRARILRRDAYICHVCHLAGADEVDHIIPASRGGTDHEMNLAAIHHACHVVKTAREAGRVSRQREPEPHPGLVRGGG